MSKSKRSILCLIFVISSACSSSLFAGPPECSDPEHANKEYCKR
jgi:hypothetical protein